MKKILSISILLFIIACEDDKADETAAVNFFDGTYKLSLESSDCNGQLDVQYITIDGLKVTKWDYDGDDCDNGDDCYSTESFTATIDGDAFRVGEEGRFSTALTMVITRYATNSLKVSFDYDGTITGSEIWGYESSDIKTYSPICN
jgi:hypothetical protein|tara:strand:+ start:224 stop:661 length:438 start_codon:yes stop_codon:yes gene_type:complete